MIKKAIFAALGLTFVMALLLGRDASSYLHTSFHRAKTTVKNSVPIEFEIERARRMVDNLLPDIRRNMHVIAQEEVEIERLDKQIAQTTIGLDREKAEIMRLKDDLSQDKNEYRYAGRMYTVSQVKHDLSSRFERYKVQEATLASLQDIHLARRKSLDAARQKLEGMLTARRQLKVDVENLEAQLKMVEVAQTTCQYNIDDSQLGRARELIGEVRTRLNVAERLANADVDLTDEIPVSVPTSDDIVDKVTEYFGRPVETTQIAEAQAPELE